MPEFMDTHVHFCLEHADSYIGAFEDVGLAGVFNITQPEVSGDPDDVGELPRLMAETDRLTGGASATFWWPNYKLCTDPDFPAKVAAKLSELAGEGLAGLKVWKDMGLGIRDPQGDLMMLDDERLNPIWEKLCELGLMLIAHVADPANFWLPMDETNPSFEMLKKFPEWHFGKPGLPSREELYAARERFLDRWSDLVVLNCHFGGYSPDAATLSGWMDRWPNFHASIGARHFRDDDETIPALIEAHGDRITFETDLGMRPGKAVDIPWNGEMYSTAFKRLAGIFAPAGEEALKSFAHGNAQRLLARIRS